MTHILLTYLPLCGAVLAAWGVGLLMGRDDAPGRVMLERERCARLALAIRPHGMHAAGRMAAEHHASRIHAAILGHDAPDPRTPVTAA